MDSPPDIARPFQWILILGFVATICLPGLWALCGLEDSRASAAAEQRVVAAFPGAPGNLEQASDWPARFQVWFDDHLGFRRLLIRWYSQLCLFVFGVSPSDRITLGKDGWMFIGFKDYTDNFRATDPFTDKDLINWQRALEQKRDWFAQRGIRYVFVVAPSKSTIYPEKMPDRFTRVGEFTRCDQLMAHLRKHSDVEILDVRQALRDEKRAGKLLYYPYGTHWNDLGAFVATGKIVERLAELWYPQMRPEPLGNYEMVERRDEGEDTWATRLHIDDLMVQDYIRLRRSAPPLINAVRLGTDREWVLRFDTPFSRRPRAVLLRDSFGTALAPFLAPHFSHLTCLWQQGYHDLSKLRQEILDARPDVVIDLMVERLLTDKRPFFLLD